METPSYWCNLLPELTALIATKVVSRKDLIVLGSVSKAWQLATSYVKHPESPPDFPMLMLPDGTHYDSDDEGKLVENQENKVAKARCFYNIFSATSSSIELPEAYGKRCLGASFGWLLAMSMNQDIKLLHPFSRREIDLPDCRSLMPLSQYADLSDEKFYFVFNIFITKAILTSPPEDEKNCIILIIFNFIGDFAFTRIGDERWTVIENSCGGRDIAYFNSLLYVVSNTGAVYSCNINDERPKLEAISPALPDKFQYYSFYLVELDGHLLLVSRIYSGSFYGVFVDGDGDGDHIDVGNDTDTDNEDNENPAEGLRYYTSTFVIFKEEDTNDEAVYPYQFVRVETFGDGALFLGNTPSTSISCSGNDSPIQSDCIYFTDDNLDMFPDNSGGYDMGIYNMKDKSIQRHYTGPSRSMHCPPLWYI